MWAQWFIFVETQTLVSEVCISADSWRWRHQKSNSHVSKKKGASINSSPGWSLLQGWLDPKVVPELHVFSPSPSSTFSLRWHHSQAGFPLMGVRWLLGARGLQPVQWKEGTSPEFAQEPVSWSSLSPIGWPGSHDHPRSGRSDALISQPCVTCPPEQGGVGTVRNAGLVVGESCFSEERNGKCVWERHSAVDPQSPLPHPPGKTT